MTGRLCKFLTSEDCVDLFEVLDGGIAKHI